MKKRAPPLLPEIGDRCRLRGREAAGVLRQVNKYLWSVVEWDADKKGPGLVHLHELERE